jgi:hypothetical protein
VKSIHPSGDDGRPDAGIEEDPAGQVELFPNAFQPVGLETVGVYANFLKDPVDLGGRFLLGL